jgi:hypothetical protein
MRKMKRVLYGPNGETALVPKDEAMGVIMSRTMMSQEFGWGF